MNKLTAALHGFMASMLDMMDNLLRIAAQIRDLVEQWRTHEQRNYGPHVIPFSRRDRNLRQGHRA